MARTKTWDTLSLTKEAKEVYDEWVRIKRFNNKIHHISSFLIEILREDIEREKLQNHIGIGMYPQITTAIGKLHLKVIQKFFGTSPPNQWDDYAKRSNRLPQNKFLDIIREVFKIKDAGVVRRHKNDILNMINFKAFQEKGQWYIAHNDYQTETTSLLFNKEIMQLVKLIHNKGELNYEEVVKQCVSSEMKIQFDQLISQYDIKLHHIAFGKKKYISLKEQKCEVIAR